VWDFGRTSATQKAASLGNESALKRLEQSKEQFLRQVLVAYVQVSRYELLVEVGQNTRMALEELERLEARRVALGGAGITDGTLASSGLALSMNKVLQFEQSLQDARSKLDSLLGSPLQANRLPVMQVPRTWTVGISPDVDPISVSATLEAQRINVDQARAELDADKSGRYPAVDLTYTKLYEYPGGYSAKAQVGIQMSVGSAAALEASARVTRSISRLETEIQKLESIDREVRQKIRSGLQRQDLLGKRVELLASAAGDSRVVVDARRKLNEAGRETTLALLDAQVEANNTFVDWVQAIYDSRVGEIELAGDTGLLLPEEGYELAWLMALFDGKDYSADVRKQLTAIGSMPPAEKKAQISMHLLAGMPSLRVGLAAPSNPVVELAHRADVINRTFFRLEMKPFARPAGRW
jgi:outer membrane protein TolC